MGQGLKKIRPNVPLQTTQTNTGRSIQQLALGSKRISTVSMSFPRLVCLHGCNWKSSLKKEAVCSCAPQRRFGGKNGRERAPGVCRRGNDTSTITATKKKEIRCNENPEERHYSRYPLPFQLQREQQNVQGPTCVCIFSCFINMIWSFYEYQSQCFA